MDPEVLAHRDASAAPFDVVQARDLHLRVVVHTITSVRGGLPRIVDRSRHDAAPEQGAERLQARISCSPWLSPAPWLVS
jgi:hypothetical protein